MFALMVGASHVPGIGDWVGGRFASFNPFQRNTIDHTGPAVLQSLTRLSEFKAASAYFEVVVHLDDKSRVPGFIAGDRIVYVGKGEVEAVVDFGELDHRRIDLSEDGMSVTVRLPSPALEDPRLNEDTSHIVFHDEGLITKFKGSDAERNARRQAIARMRAAAHSEGRLVEMAKDSTTSMLRGLFGSLGYTSITVTFDDPSSKDT
ncbi:MAG TPA: DUF4230 domain-containing protein [Acidimicrobiales bacterium]|nr:DUF4230 domain-containing protein [Acidimicrobiales bacterium]